MSIENLIFIFFIFAFVGWNIELVFRSLYEKQFVNPGVHYGPWLPIYGFCGAIIYIVSGTLASQPLLLRMVFYFVLCTSLEFLAGVFLVRTYNKRYWDYTANKFNIMGHICPKYSLCWVLVSVIVEHFILPEVNYVTDMMSGNAIITVDMVLLLLIGIDIAVTNGIFKKNSIRKIRNMLRI